MITDFTRRYSNFDIRSAVVPLGEFRPFPSASDRDTWQEILQKEGAWAVRDHHVGRAEAVLDDPIPEIRATMRMAYLREGVRSREERPAFLRRGNLGSLVLAECFEGEGRFVDGVIDYLWAICEETAWAHAAHTGYDPGDQLGTSDPRSFDRQVDLFASQTAHVLAEAAYLVRDGIAATAPVLFRIVNEQIQARVLEQVEARCDFWWLQGRNNWAPWCACNVLSAANLTVIGAERYAGLALKMLEVIERFVNRYGDDGGCDEGPAYWTHAAGAMFRFLEALHDRTGGAISFWDIPKLRAMGEYIVSARLAGPWYMNFADCVARLRPSAGLVYRYGERVGSAAMMNEALHLAAQELRGSQTPGDAGAENESLLRTLRDLRWLPSSIAAPQRDLPLTTWLGDIQVMIARETPDSCEGLTLAVKGGHNGESHNHNDLGHAILLLDGEPMIVDAGSDDYTRDTFGPRRYELWFTRGRSHNAPVIDGHEQAPGEHHRATDVLFAQGEDCQSLSLSLAQAYPAEAGLRNLTRTVRLRLRDRAQVEITDAWQLEQGDKTFAWTFLTPAEVERTDQGCVLSRAGCQLLMSWPIGGLVCEVREVALTGGNMRRSWGERLYALECRLEDQPVTGSMQFEFHRACS